MSRSAPPTLWMRSWHFPILEPTLENGIVNGIFEIGDPNFGNLWTNIPLALFEQAGFAYGDTLSLTMRHRGPGGVF